MSQQVNTSDVRYFVKNKWLLCPRPIGGGIKRWCCLTSDVCLSVAYIGPKSRTERPTKTKIGTEVAHVTRDSDSDTTFKVKRSKVKVTSPPWSPPCWRVRRLLRWTSERVGRGETAATLPSARRRKALRRPWGGEGRGISWRPHAYSLLKLVDVWQSYSKNATQAIW